jgi:hypothetical protein
MKQPPFIVIIIVLAALLAVNATLMSVYMIPFGFAGFLVFLFIEFAIIFTSFLIIILDNEHSYRPITLTLVIYGFPIMLTVLAVLSFTRGLATFGRDHIATFIVAGY